MCYYKCHGESMEGSIVHTHKLIETQDAVEINLNI